MANTTGKFTLSGYYNVTAQSPLDVRTLVTSESDLTAKDSWNKKTHPPYKGMIVVVEETGDLYTLLDETKTTLRTSWKKISGEGSGGSYDGPKIWTGTQAQYDELTPVGDTIYYIQEDGD